MSYFTCRPRLTRKLLFLSMWFGLVGGGIHAEVLSGDQNWAPLWTAWLLFGFYPSRWYANLVTPFLITMIVCPRCHFAMDAYGIWSVGSYTDHRERHILRVRSKLDGSYVGHTACPQCGSTILVL